MDAIAVEVVVEATSACLDGARAEAALTEALASARAPRRGRAGTSWRVILDIEDAGRGARSATARIVDDEGASVAERTVSDRGACAPLARAVGAWAALVLDDELARARDAPGATSPQGPALGSAGGELAPPTLEGSDWRSPHDPDYVSPRLERSWTLELGLMGYVRDGLSSTTGFAGGSVFVAVEVKPGWFVRPALFYGASTARVETQILDGTELAHLSHVTQRADFCRRFPGNYIERRGLELDLCVGGDASVVSGGQRDAYRVSVGPAAAFRGELGSNANLELRLASGYNFVRDALRVEPRASVFYAQAEVGVSWRFR